MATSLEIIVGTYEEYLLGYRVKCSKETSREYDLIQSFSVHSHTSSIRAVASSGKFIASGGADDRICLYNIEKRREIDDLYIHDGTINTLAFVPDGSYLLSGGADGKIVFVKTNNWKTDKIFEKAHKGSVNHISIHPSGKLALSLGSDLTLRTWNLITGRQAYATNLKNKKSLGGIIDIVSWSISGDYFALTGKDCVEIWDINTAEVIKTKKCESKPTAISWLSDQDLFVGMESGKLLFFNWQDKGDDEDTICEVYDKRIKSMTYSKGFLVTASSSGELNLWKVTTGDKIEMDMICGIDVGCRLICVALTDLQVDGVDIEVKQESEDEPELIRTEVKKLKTTGQVTVEIEEPEISSKNSKKRKSNLDANTSAELNSSSKRMSETPNKKKNKRKSVTKPNNGFVEEDI